MIFFRRFSAFLSLFDFFGTNIQFFINKKEKVKSPFGGFSSLIVIFLAFYLLGQNLYACQTIHNFKVISSTQCTTPTEILANNQSSPFTFSYQNYYIYFKVIFS